MGMCIDVFMDMCIDVFMDICTPQACGHGRTLAHRSARARTHARTDKLSDRKKMHFQEGHNGRSFTPPTAPAPQVCADRHVCWHVCGRLCIYACIDVGMCVDVCPNTFASQGARTHVCTHARTHAQTSSEIKRNACFRRRARAAPSHHRARQYHRCLWYGHECWHVCG